MGIDKFGVMGFSAGAPYALSVAHEHPSRITAAVCVGCPVPAAVMGRDATVRDRLDSLILSTLPSALIGAPLALGARALAALTRLAPRCALWLLARREPKAVRAGVVGEAGLSEAVGAALELRATAAELGHDAWVTQVSSSDTHARTHARTHVHTCTRTHSRARTQH